MVKVPTAQDAGFGQARTNAAPSGFQNLNVSADALGGRQGQQLQQLGRTAGNIALTMDAKQRKAEQERIESEDTAFAYDQYSKANERVRSLQTSSLSTQGNSSVGITKLGTVEIDKIQQDSIGELKNPNQIEKFNRLWRVKREGVLDSIAKHEAKSLQDFKVQSLKSTIDQSASDAVANYTNPKALALNIFQGEEAIREMHKGKPSEFVEAQLDAYRSNIHIDVTERFMQNDPMFAQMYYEQNKDDILGDKRADIEGKLKGVVLREEGRALAESIISGGGSIEDWRKKARSIKDTELYDEVNSRIDKRHRQIEQEDKAKVKGLKDTAWKKIIDGGNTDDIDSLVWSSLPPETQKSMLSYEEKRNRQAPTRTDLKVWSELQDQILTDPQAFAERDLFDVINDLSESDFKKFSDRQREILSGDTSSMRQVRSWKQMADGALAEIGIKTGTEKGSEKEEAKRLSNLFHRRLNEEIEQYQVQNGKEPSGGEVQGMIDQLLIMGKSDAGSWFGSSDVYMFEGAEDFELPDEVPEKERRKILDAFVQVNPNLRLSNDDLDAKVKEYYWRKLGFDRNGKRIR